LDCFCYRPLVRGSSWKCFLNSHVLKKYIARATILTQWSVPGQRIITSLWYFLRKIWVPRNHCWLQDIFANRSQLLSNIQIAQWFAEIRLTYSWPELAEIRTFKSKLQLRCPLCPIPVLEQPGVWKRLCKTLKLANGLLGSHRSHLWPSRPNVLSEGQISPVPWSVNACISPLDEELNFSFLAQVANVGGFGWELVRRKEKSIKWREYHPASRHRQWLEFAYFT